MEIKDEQSQDQTPSPTQPPTQTQTPEQNVNVQMIDNSIIPYDEYKLLSRKELAAILGFKRHERFDENYLITDHLLTTIRKFFGNLNYLHSNGLVAQYKRLKQFVVDKHVIGLFLFGKVCNRKHSTFIHEYKTESGKILELTTQSISKILIEQHFKYEEVQYLCQFSPNYPIYLRAVQEFEKEHSITLM